MGSAGESAYLVHAHPRHRLLARIPHLLATQDEADRFAQGRSAPVSLRHRPADHRSPDASKAHSRPAPWLITSPARLLVLLVAALTADRVDIGARQRLGEGLPLSSTADQSLACAKCSSKPARDVTHAVCPDLRASWRVLTHGESAPRAAARRAFSLTSCITE